MSVNDTDQSNKAHRTSQSSAKTNKKKTKKNDCHGTQTMDGPVIPLFDVELLHWSSTWLNTLVVNILGKRVNFRILETKVQRDWERKGTIQIIDLHDGYYQIVFSKEYSCYSSCLVQEGCR